MTARGGIFAALIVVGCASPQSMHDDPSRAPDMAVAPDLAPGVGGNGCSSDGDCPRVAFCDGVPTCHSGSCTVAPRSCDDHDACTVDKCDPNQAMCTHAPIDTTHDPLNCGSCGNVCPSGPHSFPGCAASACTLACDVGYGRAGDPDPSHGCTCFITSTVDVPDPSFSDENCDGIDGDIAHAIFVDQARGNDGNAGTMSEPVASIGRGIALAAQQKKDVYVSKGPYAAITLAAGVNVYGGYDASSNWKRAADNVVTISGATVGVSANGITVETHLELVTVVSGHAGGTGGSSYAVSIVNSPGPIVVRDSVVRAGNGSDGGSGANGARGDGADLNPGGYNGGGAWGACNGNCGGNCGLHGNGGGSACGRYGGNGGDGACGDSTGGAGGWGVGGTPGGNGGHGCTNNFCGNCSAADHSPQATRGWDGADGANGGNGAHAAPFGGVLYASYVPAAGYDGGDGVDGNGAGGGGAGGGSNGTFCDKDRGAGGGGGGGAGCRGWAGRAGSGGGGSFGFFLLGSSVTVQRCGITTGSGGRGGNGGYGGVGGAGGSGGPGGPSSDDGDWGNWGGNGGHGGAGGNGSGGSGGPSIGIYARSSTLANDSNTFSIGGGGVGGAGGSNATAGAAPGGWNGIATLVRQE